MSLKKSDSYSILLFLSLIIAWFSNVIFSNQIFCYGDLSRYFYPVRHFASLAITQEHRIPLWNPYIFMGHPFLGMLQSAVFYPVCALFYILPNFDLAFNYFIIIHFLMAGLFMYALMRHFSAGWAASLAAAFVFTFSGYLSSVINMNTSLASAVWAPLILLAFDKLIRGRQIKYLIATSVLLTVQFLGAEPTIIYCMLWILFFYGAGYIAFVEKSLINRFKIAIAFGAAVIIFLLLSSFQILPFAELLSSASRLANKSFEETARSSVSPGEMLGLIIPYIFGNISIAGGYLAPQQWLVSFYAGIISIALAILAFLIKPGKKVIFFGCVFAFSLILAMGKFTPVYILLYKFVPGVDLIRYPVKYLFITTFTLAILAGFGFDAIMLKIRNGLRRKIAKRLLFINGAAAILVLLAFKYSSKIFALASKFASPNSKMDKHTMDVLTKVFTFDFARICLLFIVLSLALLCIILFLRNKIGRNVFCFCLLSLIFLDLMDAHCLMTKTMDIGHFKREPDSFKRILEDKSIFRVYLTPKAEELNKSVYGLDYSEGLAARKETFVTNAPMLYGISVVSGYESIIRADYNDFYGLLREDKEELSLKLFDLANVIYVVSVRPIKKKGYKVIYEGLVARLPIKIEKELFKKFYVNKNSNFLPRAFFVNRFQVVKDKNTTLNILKNKYFDPARLIILSENFHPPYKIDYNAPDGKDAANIVSYKPEKVIIETILLSPKFLLLSDAFYPGWKVYVDNRQDKIYRADYLFRAVYLDKGAHKVEFVYEPDSFKIGSIISLITAGIILAFLSIIGIRKK